MLYAILVGFGFYGLSQLQLDLFPELSFPSVVIISNYTGASPEDIETIITRPIESAVASVKDVKQIDSDSKQGASVVTVQFDWGKNMEQAETDVRRALDMGRGNLPDDVKDPLVFAFDPALQPVVMTMLTGPYPLDELRRIAEKEIQPRIERLPGIASAEIAGGLEREVHVIVNPAKVTAFGLNPAQVVGAIYQENTQIPGGTLEQGALDFTIHASGKYTSIEEIGQVVVGMRPTLRGPVPIQLREVAQVIDTFSESQRILEIDGQPGVWILVRKQSGANTVKAAEAVNQALPQFKKVVAAGIDFKTIFDQSDFINLALGNLSSTGIEGVFITFFVLLVFLRSWRSSLIVASAIPASVIGTFLIMHVAGMTLNMISMAGLALSIGMLVDNAIVVLENIFRLREEGHGAWNAAIEGAGGVSMAVTASTLTTVAVFLPVLFVPGIAGVLFRDMAVTICFSLTVSLLLALTLVPLACSRMLGTRAGEADLIRSQKKDILTKPRALLDRSLDWALGHRKWVGASVGALLIGTAALYAVLPTDFITQDDNSMVYVSAESAVGENLAQAHAVMTEALDVVAKTILPEERKLIALDQGVGKGFVAIFGKGVHAGAIRVSLVQPGQRKRTKAQIEAAVRAELKQIPGLKATVGEPFNMMGGAGDVEIEIRGHDLEMSRRIGRELREELRALPEMASVDFSMDDQKPEIRVSFDRPKMAQLGLSAAAAGGAISTYFMGSIAGRYAEGGDEYDIVVRFDKRNRLDVEELRRMPVTTPTGQVVPLANIARIDVGLGPTDIKRRDQGRITTLACYLKPSYEDAQGVSHMKDLGASIAKVDGLISRYDWPKDFSYFVGGTAEDFLESFRYLGLALILAVLLVYMVMSSQFESFREPLIIIIAVPLAAIGVVPIFSITQKPMDVSSLIGVIMLVGIVVNNGIVLVDAANQLRHEYPDRRDAVQKAALQRLRPVLLTALTTVLAMVPLALGIGEGAASWQGMAMAVIGGMITSTFLTMYVVPTMYTFLGAKHITPNESEIAAIDAASIREHEEVRRELAV